MLVSRERTGCIVRNFTGFLFPFHLPNSMTFTPYQTEDTFYSVHVSYEGVLTKVFDDKSN